MLVLWVAVLSSPATSLSDAKIWRKDYFNPSYFWPLDYASRLTEVVEQRVPKVFGDRQLSIVGTGQGHLKFGVASSAATLKLDETSCLARLSNCTGFTICAWLRIDNVRREPELAGLAQVFGSLGADGKYHFRIAFVKERKASLNLRVLVNQSNVAEWSSDNIRADIWNHVAVTFSTSLGLAVHLNGKKVTSHVKGGEFVQDSKSNLILGTFPIKFDDLSPFKSSSISVSNLAIWDRILEHGELEGIYSTELGGVGLLPSCKSEEGKFSITWKRPVDSFGQFISYIASWWRRDTSDLVHETSLQAFHASNTTEETEVNSTNYMVVHVDVYDADALYCTQVHAVTRSGIKLFSSIEVCNTSGLVRGEGLKILASSPTSVDIRWQSADYDPNIRTVYAISYANISPGADRNQSQSRSKVAFMKPGGLEEHLQSLQPNSQYAVQVVRVKDGKRTFVRANITTPSADHDECEYGALQSCGPHSICTNTPGSYFCSCIDGYVLIGKECYDKNSTKSTSEDECDGEESRGVFWPPTKLGFLVTRPCPEGSTGEATRLCLALRKTHKPKWQRPSLRHCVSGWVKNLRTRVKNMRSITGAPVASPRILSAAEELRESLLKSEMIHGGDVNGIVEVLDSLVIFNSAALGKNLSHSTSFAESGLRVTNELVDRKSLIAWHDLTEQQRLVDADKLLTATERLAEESIALAGNSSSKEFVIEEKNVVMKVRQVASREDVDKVIVTNSSEVLLPPLMTHDGSRISLAVIEYRGMSEILGNPGNASLKARGFNTTLSSHVLSVTVFPKNLSAFHEPFVMVHKLSQQEGSGYTPNCVYWESPTDSSGGIWSDDGCRVRSANVSHVTCECSHLTNFAILMSVTDASRKMEEKHRLALNLITLIGITISLLALFLALLTFVFVRSIRSIRNTIHQNLAVALFIAELLFLAGIERTDYRIGCVIIGAALHYFFLVAFFVMGLEGIVLYLMLVKVYRSTGSTGYGNPKMVIACWVIPIAFVAVNIAVDRTAYGNDSYCWLSVQNGFIWSFVGPVLFVNLVNCVIFLLTIRVMMTKAKKRDSTTSEIWFWTKGSCLLLSILGITWVVGVFFVDRNTLPLAYVFTLLNCLQGLSVFVFHCLCDPRVRKAYFMLFCCVQPDGSSLIRRSTFSTPTRTSSSASSLLKKKRGTPKERKEPQDPSKELISSSGSASKAADNSLAALVGPNSM